MSSKVSKFSRHRHFNNQLMSISMCDKVSMLVYRHLSEKIDMSMSVYRTFSEKVIVSMVYRVEGRRHFQSVYVGHRHFIKCL